MREASYSLSTTKVRVGGKPFSREENRPCLSPPHDTPIWSLVTSHTVSAKRKQMMWLIRWALALVKPKG